MFHGFYISLLYIYLTIVIFMFRGYYSRFGCDLYFVYMELCQSITGYDQSLPGMVLFDECHCHIENVILRVVFNVIFLEVFW